MVNQNINYHQIFSTLDSVGCLGLDCTDDSNISYLLSAGYIGDSILVKLDTETASIYRYSGLTTVVEAEERLVLIIHQKQLRVKSVTYYLDESFLNLKADYYTTDNQLEYSFSSEIIAGGVVLFNYHIFSDRINSDEVEENYQYFLAILELHRGRFTVVEQLPLLSHYIRMKKVASVLLED